VVEAFAPVNIAWIKYMGKIDGHPTNASFSMTLDSLGTWTRVSFIGDASEWSFDFEGSPYVPPKEGLQKVRRFLSNPAPFLEVLKLSGIEGRVRPGHYRIHTRNLVPAGTGIATSASGFAALTLAWLAVLAGPALSEWIKKYDSSDDLALKLKRAAAQVARLGSGSACRSFEGPFVEWFEDHQLKVFSDSRVRYVDFILLLETGVKAVTSSDAHQRVSTSPLFKGRRERASTRLERLKFLMHSSGDSAELAKLVREEALDMHELFHTSQPPFRYFNRESERWWERVVSPEFPVKNPLVTADAGANLHIFVPEDQSPVLDAWLKERYPKLAFLKAAAGKGAFYGDSSF